ncbi:MAG: hypothetical protein IJS88_07030 [Alphaproteobacteria bacterium]|nr:hypothetical protein [Alphaproteobacteria bacterium]
MAENIDYEALIDELAQSETAPERLVEIQQTLGQVPYAQRNDNLDFVWKETYDKANEMIEKLAEQSLKGASLDDLKALDNLLETFASHTNGEYTGLAAELKGKIDKRREELPSETPSPANEEQKETPLEESSIETKEEEKEKAPEAGNEEPINIHDEKDEEFLDSITDENKAQIGSRYERLDAAAQAIGNVFENNPEKNQNVDFSGIKNFFDNVWIDQSLPDDPDKEPTKEDVQKRDELRSQMFDLAVNMSLKDLVKDEAVDKGDDKELQKKLLETIHDNMTFLSYNLVGNQQAFEAMERGTDISKLTPAERKAYIDMQMSSTNDAMAAATAALNGKRSPIRASSAAICAAVASPARQVEDFAEGFKEKTGIGKLWNRVKTFDEHMTKTHPRLYPLAKSLAISSIGGPGATMAYVGYNTFKAGKKVFDEYKAQKAATGMTFKEYWSDNKNKAKIAGVALSVVSAAISTCAGINGITNGNFGIAGNLTGSMLSGSASIGDIANQGWNQISESAGNLINKLSDVNNLNPLNAGKKIIDTFANRGWMNVLTATNAANTSYRAYLEAPQGKKMEAARKAFIGSFTGTFIGLAASQAVASMTHQAAENNNTPVDIKSIEAGEKEFMDAYKEAELNHEFDMNIYRPQEEIDGSQLDEIEVIGSAHHHEAPTIQHESTTGVHEVFHEAEKPSTGLPEVGFVVNNEDVSIADSGNLEDNLNAARGNYLNHHPEIDFGNNSVEITGEDLDATITTSTEELKHNDTVIGYEKSVDTVIKSSELDMERHEQLAHTDTGEVKLTTNEGVVAASGNENIPEGAKIVSVVDFKNDQSELHITKFEVTDENGDVKSYIADNSGNVKETPANYDENKIYANGKGLVHDTAVTKLEAEQQKAETEQTGAQAVNLGVVEKPADQMDMSEIREQQKAAPEAEQTGAQAVNLGVIEKPADQMDMSEIREQQKAALETEQTGAQAETKQEQHEDNSSEASVPIHEVNGFKYQIDENGELTGNCHLFIDNKVMDTALVQHLMPDYNSDGTQRFGGSGIDWAYKDEKGMYHCGGSIGTIKDSVRMAERIALQTIVKNNVAYNDLALKDQETLTDGEKKFMHNHEAALEKRGLVNQKGGVLEYKDCPPSKYCHHIHDKVALADANAQDNVSYFENRARDLYIKGNLTTSVEDGRAVSVGKNGVMITDDKGNLQTYTLDKEGLHRIRGSGNITAEELTQIKSDIAKVAGEDNKLLKQITALEKSGQQRFPSAAPIRATTLDTRTMTQNRGNTNG